MPKLPTLEEYDRGFGMEACEEQEDEYLDFYYSIHENPIEAFDRTTQEAFLLGKALASEIELTGSGKAENIIKDNWKTLEGKVDSIVDNLMAEYKDEFPDLSKKEKDQIDISVLKSSVVYGLLEELENKD